MKILLAIHKRLMSFYLIIAFILVWQFSSKFGWTNATFVPPFTTVLTEGADLGLARILVHIAISLKRVVFGFALSTVIALPLGFVLADGAPKLAAFLRPLMQFLSQIPPFILYPLFLLVIGPGENGIYIVIFWSVFWPVLFTTMQGVNDIDPRLIRAAKSMRASTGDVLFKVIFPAIFPNVMRGIRSGLTMGFLMLIGSESMGADSGIGWMIHNAQGLGWIPRIYLGALIVCVVGFLLNGALGAVEKTFVDWKEVPEDVII